MAYINISGGDPVKSRKASDALDLHTTLLQGEKRPKLAKNPPCSSSTFQPVQRKISVAKKIKTSYDPELKAEVIRLIQDKSLTVAQASKKYGIPTQTLYSWAPKSGIKKLSRKKIKTIRSQKIPICPHLTGVPKSTEIHLVAAAMDEGFDSTSFLELCRKYSVQADDVRQIVDWGNQYGGQGLGFTGALEVSISEMRHKIRELSDTVAEQQAIISEMGKSKDYQISALAQYAYLFLSKKAKVIYRE